MFGMLLLPLIERESRRFWSIVPPLMEISLADFMPVPVPRKTPKHPPLIRPKGRPCLLTPEVEGTVIFAIEKGMSYKMAAMLAGISYDSLNRWVKRGENENAPDAFCHLYKAVERAKAVGMLRHLSVIDEAGQKGDWRASSWLLERRHPEEFGKIAVEEKVKGTRPAYLAEPIEHEVLARIKKQNGIKNITFLVAQNLEKIKAEKAAKLEEEADSKTNFRGDD